tara:strand:+ start:2340 stop:2561 length:222 start_codon:yes stop_codon:yes gene_type:complete
MSNEDLTEIKLELTRHIEREQQLREDVSELKTDMTCVKRSIFQVKWLVIGAVCATLAMQSGISTVVARILIGI